MFIIINTRSDFGVTSYYVFLFFNTLLTLFDFVDENKSLGKLPVDLSTQQKVYRNLVLKDLIDSEKANVAELQTLINNFLHPLEKSDV